MTGVGGVVKVATMAAWKNCAGVSWLQATEARNNPRPILGGACNSPRVTLVGPCHNPNSTPGGHCSNPMPPRRGRHNNPGAHSRRPLRFGARCLAPDGTEHSVGPPPAPPVEIPLFPLPLVLFPGAVLPLQIFEYRYRIMMHTLLQTDLRFGVIYTAGQDLAAVGCVGEVIKHERLVDDRFFLICKGQERFKVLNVVRTKPYVVAQVQWLEDRPSDSDSSLEALSNDVESYMKDVIRLSNRLNGKPDKETPDGLRKNLFPTPFSFWVGSTFEGAPAEQQALLELDDTAQRLSREKETLRNTLNYLSAAAAVRDAFPSSSDPSGNREP